MFEFRLEFCLARSSVLNFVGCFLFVIAHVLQVVVLKFTELLGHVALLRGVVGGHNIVNYNVLT